MNLRKLSLLPQLIWYTLRAPRDPAKAWDRYWSGIQRTGAGGDVLWDAASAEELDRVAARVVERMDRTLPLVDVGCGNGRFSRLLAAHAPRVVGVDVSPAAVARAREESRGVENVEFRVMDASRPGAGDELARELGEVNVYTRGVLHVFSTEQRVAAVANLAAMLGRRGVAYVVETDYVGDPLDQLLAQGATATHLPEPVRRCIAAGVKPPMHFGDEQLREFFPASAWEVLESGPVTLHGLPMTTTAEFEPIPGFSALVRRREAAAS